MVTINAIEHPELIDPRDEEGQRRLIELSREGSVVCIDRYREMIRELVAIREPASYFGPTFNDRVMNFAQERSGQDNDMTKDGMWVYFPWRHTLVHVLSESEYCEVRTSRNRELISPEEQNKFYDATIGIAGLSVGMSIALAIVLEGGGKHLRIADNDTLELSNTNRILGGLCDLGKPKINVIAERLYEMNPYLDITFFPSGISEINAEEFVSGLDILVEEVDNLSIKFLLRDIARAMSIPVVMATDVEEGSMLDIDRFDCDPRAKSFHGRFGNVTKEEVSSMSKRDIGMLVAGFVGKENTSERMLLSLGEVGKSLVSWPQIGGAALMSGALGAYALRRILSGDESLTDRIMLPLPTPPLHK